MCAQTINTKHMNYAKHVNQYELIPTATNDQYEPHNPQRELGRDCVKGLCPNKEEQDMTTSIDTYAYAKWIERLIQQGFHPWFVTFMFDQLPGSPATYQQQMLQTVDRVYGIRITRVLKHPTAASSRHRRPIWLAAPDLPVFKHLKGSLRDVTINDGLHVHAIVLEPSIRWQTACFAEFVWAEQWLWRRLCPTLERIDVRAITHDVPRVVGYALKNIEQRVSSDSVLILPRTNDELRRSSSRIGRQSSIYGSTRRVTKVYQM